MIEEEAGASAEKPGYFGNTRIPRTSGNRTMSEWTNGHLHLLALPGAQ